MLVHSCKLFRQCYIVILGMVQIMMCKYSNVIKPDLFLCQLLSPSSDRLPWGGNTSSLLDQDTSFICSITSHVWPSLNFVLESVEDKSTVQTGKTVKRMTQHTVEATSPSPARENMDLYTYSSAFIPL